MAQNPPFDGELDALLAYIHERRNFDFRGYKRASLSRRIYRRMQLLGLDNYQRYMEVLEANPGEFGELFNTILINVTSFLRDKDSWEALSANVIPVILHAKERGEPIRVWSAGTASGEEAYSLAVLLCEAVGEERFRADVKIYATDADTDALTAARHGRYPQASVVQAFGDQRAQRFFELEDGYGTFRVELRRSLIFGRHDLVQDPPISKIDLLACRNTLMYFTAEVQQQILRSFHFALTSGGFLFLGKSEALASRVPLFESVDARQHIFRKSGSRREGQPPVPSLAGRQRASVELGSKIGDILLEQSPVAQVVVDAQMAVVAANLQARRLLSIGSTEVGLVFRPVGLSIDPSDLARQVGVVLRERRVVTVDDVGFSGRSGAGLVFDLVLSPLNGPGGVVVTFLDVTRYRDLGDQLERSQRELESAYEDLQSAIEELETTNEELQSTNEELETTNEELHSTNEELETINEELQSTNEELETINTELRDRSAEVSDLNVFLESILTNMKAAVIVLGPEMEVRTWNRKAEDLWGLRAEEVKEQHFLNLDIGFPVETLGQVIRSTLAGRVDGALVVQQGVNRRGRTVDCAVTVSRLVSDDTVRGVILIMEATPLTDPAADGSSEGHSMPDRSLRADAETTRSG